MSETFYDIAEMGRLLRTAGWNGQGAAFGWLFHAYVAAEGAANAGPVCAELSRRFDLPWSAALTEAAELIWTDAQQSGPRRRPELSTLENGIAWKVKYP